MRPKLKVISFDKEQDKIVEIEQKIETFADVGGLEEVKKKIKVDFIMPIQSPHIYAENLNQSEEEETKYQKLMEQMDLDGEEF